MRKIWITITNFFKKSIKISDKVTNDVENKLLKYKTQCPNCDKVFFIEFENNLLEKSNTKITACPKCRANLVTVVTDKSGDKIALSILKGDFKRQINSVKGSSLMLNDALSLNSEKNFELKKQKATDYYNKYLIRPNDKTIIQKIFVIRY